MPNQPEQEWVIATWVGTSSLTLYAVYSKEGSPRADLQPTCHLLSMYRWNSYHAARKFQRQHRDLAGWFVLDLAEALAQCQGELRRIAKAASRQWTRLRGHRVPLALLRHGPAPGGTDDP